MKKILIVEDEDRMRRLIKDYLVRFGYEVIEADDGYKGLDLFTKEQPQMAILDWMLPGMDGVELCHEIKELSKIPVIMLTAKSDEKDELEGLKFGADDYITKPFSPKILMARIEALFRYTDRFNEKIVESGLTIDNAQHRILLDGIELKLTPKEYELLIYMSTNQKITLSRDKILTSVWGYDYDGDLRTVDTHIKRLRKKLDGRFINTVRGYGYRFEVE